MLSGRVLLVTVTGRRSGRRYGTPAQDAQDGDTLYLVSHARQRWWRNLHGGAPVELQLRGRRARGRGELLEPASAEAEQAREVLRGSALRRALDRADAVLLRVRLDDGAEEAR